MRKLLTTTVLVAIGSGAFALDYKKDFALFEAGSYNGDVAGDGWETNHPGQLLKTGEKTLKPGTPKLWMHSVTQYHINRNATTSGFFGGTHPLLEILAKDNHLTTSQLMQFLDAYIRPGLSVDDFVAELKQDAKRFWAGYQKTTTQPRT